MKVITCETISHGEPAISVIKADEEIGPLTQLKQLAREQSQWFWDQGKDATTKIDEKDSSASCHCSYITVKFSMRELQQSKVIEALKEKRENTKAMIEFTIPVYLDNLSLLKENPNIKALVRDQIMQGDPGFKIGSEIEAEGEELGIDGETASAFFESCDLDRLMDYVIVNEDDIDVNYSETYECRNARITVYDISCLFDTGRFLSDHKQEIEQLEQRGEER